jgi:Lrp/AsnC family transcriptional regulator for asnA, asnC and gidA
MKRKSERAEIILLDALINNARMPKTELARRLKVTEAAVRKRLKRLEESGVILGYRVLIDHQKAGLMASITGVDVEPEKLWDVIEALKEMEEVKSISITSGDHMIMVEMVAKSMDGLEAAHRMMEKMEGVKRICPAIISKRVK